MSRREDQEACLLTPNPSATCSAGRIPSTKNKNTMEQSRLAHSGHVVGIGRAPRDLNAEPSRRSPTWVSSPIGLGAASNGPETRFGRGSPHRRVSSRPQSSTEQSYPRGVASASMPRRQTDSHSRGYIDLRGIDTPLTRSSVDAVEARGSKVRATELEIHQSCWEMRR